MPGIAIESRSEAVWFAKQTALGSPAATAIKRGYKVGGDLTVNREDGSEPRSSGLRFNDAQDYVNTIIGNGNPTIQGQPGLVSYLSYLIAGQETVNSAGGGNNDHVITPAAAGSFWFTAWKKVGQAVGPLRQKFNDCRMQSLRFEASQGAKIARVLPTFLSLDAGEIFTSDPVKVFDTDEAFSYTEGEGLFKINDVTWTGGQSSLAFTLNDGMAPWWGEGVNPYAVIPGVSTVDIEGLTILVDQKGYEYYCEQIYGITNPPIGTKPLKVLPPMGGYELWLKRGSNYSYAAPGSGTFTLTVDGQTTAAIAFGATAAAVQAAIELLTNVLVGDVTVTGTAPNFTIVFEKKVGVVMTGTPGTVTGNGHHRGCRVEFPNIKWTPDLSIAGSPDGGATELPLAGQAREDRLGVDPQVRITVRVADAAY